MTVPRDHKFGRDWSDFLSSFNIRFDNIYDPLSLYFEEKFVVREMTYCHGICAIVSILEDERAGCIALDIGAACAEPQISSAKSFDLQSVCRRRYGTQLSRKCYMPSYHPSSLSFTEN